MMHVLIQPTKWSGPHAHGRYVEENDIGEVIGVHEVLSAVMMDVSREVTNFMYENGENPFEEDEGCVEKPYVPVSDTPEGNGRLLGAFDPSYEELNVTRLTMQAW